MKCILSFEEDGFVNNLDDVGKDDIISPLQSFDFNPLSLVMVDINIWDDSLGIVQVKTLEVNDVSQIQIRLTKLNDLYVE